MPEPRRHWLVDVAGRAGLVGAHDSVVEAGAPTSDAWTAVARACGVTDPDLAARVATHYRMAVAN
jgi:hypothetical protein